MKLVTKFKELMKESHDVINKTEESKETLKRGILRAGSGGAIVGNDVYSTQCGRLAQARLLGYQSGITQEMRVMFVGGLSLEVYFEERLKALNLTYKKEEEITAIIAPGIVVSGRPDFEVFIGDEWVGVEIKSLASPFSVIKQRKNKFPFMKHLIQAATYMTLLGRDKWLIMIGHSFNVNQNGAKYPSGVVFYEVTYSRDPVEGKSFFYVTNENNESKALPFTKDHIVAYYEEVRRGAGAKQLMQRPKEKELNVDTYDRCKYCPMEDACNKYDNGQIDFEQWLGKFLTPRE